MWTIIARVSEGPTLCPGQQSYENECFATEVADTEKNLLWYGIRSYIV